MKEVLNLTYPGSLPVAHPIIAVRFFRKYYLFKLVLI